jgi:hypothetical protein
MCWRRMLVLAVFLTLIQGSASASFYCGADIIEVGDTSMEILKNCGERDYRELLGFTENGGHIKIERWYYDLGSHRLIRVLTLEGGVLTDIDKGEYGGD